MAHVSSAESRQSFIFDQVHTPVLYLHSAILKLFYLVEFYEGNDQKTRWFGCEHGDGENKTVVTASAFVLCIVNLTRSRAVCITTPLQQNKGIPVEHFFKIKMSWWHLISECSKVFGVPQHWVDVNLCYCFPLTLRLFGGDTVVNPEANTHVPMFDERVEALLPY